MILTLLAVSLNDQALTRPITARFDAAGGTIGRADHSTMALPDPERYISRKQAEIAFVGNGFTIRNVGAANPITVAQRTLGAGEAAPLRHGDEVRIGGYLLRAEYQAGPGQASGAPAPARPMARPVGDVEATIVSGAFAPSAPARPNVPAQGRAAPPRGSPVSPPLAPLAPATPAIPATPFTPSPPLPSDNPFADLLGPAPAPAVAGPALAPPASDDPFAGLMPAPAGLGQAQGVAAGGQATPARLPDDFDPFSTASQAPSPFAAAAAPPAAARGSDDPFADLLGPGNAGAPSIDQAFGLGSSDASADALARFVADPSPATPAPGAAAGLSTDPLALFGEGGNAMRPSAPAPLSPGAAGGVAIPDHVPAVHGAYAPPRVPAAAPQAPPARHKAPPPAFIPETVVVQPQAPAVAPPPPSPRAPRPSPVRAPASPGPGPAAVAPRASSRAGGADAAALWRAFCDGAGVNLPLPPGEGEALMRHIGRILRAAVEGTLQLVSVRASTKHEMRARVTQIQASGNNPLKFSADAAAGLEQLLSPPQRGFMDGASAMDDVMLDLVGHSIGTVAGMRAAIEGMLARFDPAALESRLAEGSLFSNLLPASRKARLWELYLQHHKYIRNEAEEDFHTLFGKAFVAAYEQQVERLERQQRQRQQQARR